MDNLKESIKESWFLKRWKEKLIAIVLAFIIWFFVNQSIVTSKTVTSIPVRILNIPQEKVISGLLPNGVYQKRVKLTLSGTRRVVDSIEPGDIEVVLDASAAPDEWPVEITKKNLVSLNPDLDLNRHIRDVSQPDLVIHLSQLVNDEVPIYVVPPKGQPPKGYSLIDISPRVLVQSMTGPEEEIKELERSGVALEFDLNRLIKEELDKLPSKDGEVILSIPTSWKKVKVPWITSGTIPLNSEEAAQMEMLFLKEEPVPLKNYLPLLVTFSIPTSLELGARAASLKQGGVVNQVDGLSYLNAPLQLAGTSRSFAELISPNLAIVIQGRQDREEKEGSEELLWNVVVLASKELENRYVATLGKDRSSQDWGKAESEERLREHFRNYLSSLCLASEGGKPLNLSVREEKGEIEVTLK